MSVARINLPIVSLTVKAVRIRRRLRLRWKRYKTLLQAMIPIRQALEARLQHP